MKQIETLRLIKIDLLRRIDKLAKANSELKRIKINDKNANKWSKIEALLYKKKDNRCYNMNGKLSNYYDL